MFNLLEFSEHPTWGLGATRALIFFDNGYGASVITGEYAYTTEEEPYELAVLVGDEEDYGLTYTTPVTCDVEGRLTEEQVSKLLEDISKLPPITKEE